MLIIATQPFKHTRDVLTPCGLILSRPREQPCCETLRSRFDLVTRLLRKCLIEDMLSRMDLFLNILWDNPLQIALAGQLDMALRRLMHSDHKLGILALGLRGAKWRLVQPELV